MILKRKSFSTSKEKEKEWQSWRFLPSTHLRHVSILFNLIHSFFITYAKKIVSIKKKKKKLFLIKIKKIIKDDQYEKFYPGE